MKYRDKCANCGCDLSHAKEIGVSGIFNPDGPDFELCMPCWDEEEALITDGNFQPKRLDRYYATFGERRPGLYSVHEGKYV